MKNDEFWENLVLIAKKTKIEHMKYGKITGDFCVSDEADVDLLKKTYFSEKNDDENAIWICPNSFKVGDTVWVEIIPRIGLGYFANDEADLAEVKTRFPSLKRSCVIC